MKKVLAIIIICLFPLSVHALTNQEAFELLSQSSKEIEEFPFHVHISLDYSGFRGTALPVSVYDFFVAVYDELRFKQPNEIFATYQFSQGQRWQCFLLRVPNMYVSNAISLWVFDKQQGIWQKPLKIAEQWGDAGYRIDVQAWIEDINGDGKYDLVLRSRESDIGLEELNLAPSTKKKDTVYAWETDRFKDASRKYLPRINLKKYSFN